MAASKNEAMAVVPEFVPTVLSGAAFGAALAASGVYLPSVIIDQFRLTDFHMFHVFATAVGSSAIIMLVLEKLLNLGCHPYQVDSARTPHTLASGALPSGEPVSESFLAGDEHEFDELRQRVVDDDFEPLHIPKTPRGYRHREQAGRASFTSTSIKERAKF